MAWEVVWKERGGVVAEEAKCPWQCAVPSSRIAVVFSLSPTHGSFEKLVELLS